MARKLKVIDTHAHLGGCCVFGANTTEEDLVCRSDESEVDVTIVQPYPGAKEAAKTHDQIAEMCAKISGPFPGPCKSQPAWGSRCVPA